MKAVTESVQRINHYETGRKMRLFRESKERSLRSVAEEMGISAAFLSDLERGRRNWSDKLVSQFNLALKSAKA